MEVCEGRNEVSRYETFHILYKKPHANVTLFVQSISYKMGGKIVVNILVYFWIGQCEAIPGYPRFQASDMNMYSMENVHYIP